MTIEKFAKIQKKLADLSGIPLSEIQRKFPDFRGSKEKILELVKEYRETINVLKQEEIVEEISKADPENIKSILDAVTKKYFLKKFRVSMERPEILRQLHILVSKNPEIIQGFVETGTESDVIINTIYSPLRNIFHHIARDYGIVGENRAEELFKKFLIERKDKLITILRVHLKLYNKEGSPFTEKLYQISEPQAFDRQMVNLIINAIKPYKKEVLPPSGGEAPSSDANQGQTPSS